MYTWSKNYKHETGFEPATLALARRYSTTEPLVQLYSACFPQALYIYYNINSDMSITFLKFIQIFVLSGPYTPGLHFNILSTSSVCGFLASALNTAIWCISLLLPVNAGKRKPLSGSPGSKSPASGHITHIR